MNHKAPIQNDTLLREAYEAGRVQALIEQTNTSGSGQIPLPRNPQFDVGYVPNINDLRSPEMYPGESLDAYMRRMLGWDFGGPFGSPRNWPNCT